MPEVSLQRETDSELHFRHPHVSGWIFAAIGSTVGYLGLNHVHDRFGHWLVVGVGSFFALIGIGAALWRYEVTLDLMTRTYRGLRGFWPSPRPLQGSLDELNGVVLTRKWRRSSSSNGGSHEYVVWTVSLEFRGWKKPVSVFESQNERAAYEKLEHYTKKLRTTAIDCTGNEALHRSCDELDRSLADRARSGDGLVSAPQTELPSDSPIVWTVDDGKSTIVLPALGFSFGTLFLILFGLAFASFGGFALLAVSGVLDVKTTGSAAGLWSMGTLFLLIGLVVCLAAVAGSFASSAKRVESTGQEILIRTDRHSLRVGDRLQPDEQEWLRQTLVQFAGR